MEDSWHGAVNVVGVDGVAESADCSGGIVCGVGTEVFEPFEDSVESTWVLR